jgi:hypothetical protein
VFVSENPASETPETTDYGYPLPKGWKLAEAGQGFDGKIWVLRGGDSTYIQFDFFRPSPTMQAGAEAEEINLSMCKTDFYVTASYRQERSSVKCRISIYVIISMLRVSVVMILTTTKCHCCLCCGVLLVMLVLRICGYVYAFVAI